MSNVRTRGLAKVCVAAQAVIVTLAYWAWLPASQGGSGYSGLSLSRYVLYNAVLIAGLVFAYVTVRNGNWFAQRALSVCHRNALRQTFFSISFLLVLLAVEKDRVISRTFLFTFFPILYGLLVCTHRLLPPLLQKLSFGGIRVQRVLLAGCCKNASALEDWLKGKERLGYSIAGLVCHDRASGMLHGIRILGVIEDLERVIQEQEITQVILVEFPMFRNIMVHCTEVCERNGVRLLVVCDFEHAMRHPVTMFEDDGLRFIGLREEPLEDPFVWACKRSMDIAVSLPVVLFILPVTTLMVFIIQRFQSPGPIFFRQLRSGIQKLPFVIYKYRTMYAINHDATQQASRSDHRIYPAGRWLRKFSIDELPQFINVLLGDMSVVGPRPHLWDHNESFAQALANYHVRANVKPGITGLAQVRGFRGETKTPDDIAKRVQCDIYYLEHWTFVMDCWIIFRTVGQVVFPPKSAY